MNRKRRLCLRKISCHKIFTLAIFLLFITAAWICGSQFVRATSSTDLAHSVSGTCIWRYVQEGEKTVLYISPAENAEVGTLESWKEDDDGSPPWRNAADSLHERTHKVVVKKTVKATTCYRMFKDFKKLESLELSGLDTTAVTSMRKMFSGCSKLTEIDGKTLKVSAVKSMYRMFYDCKALVSVDTRKWDTSKVKDMQAIFRECSRLTSVIGIEGWNTESLTNMSWMFDACKALTSLNLGEWDTSKVMNMQSMFRECNSLTSVGDIKKWTTGSVTNMAHMFRGCEALASLDLREWDTSKVADMESMFWRCKSLTSIVGIEKWTTGSVTNMAHMFHDCEALTSLDLSEWDTRNVIVMLSMFRKCYSLTSVGDIKDWKTGSVTDMRWMFSFCKALASLDLSGWDTRNVTDMQSMFQKCNSLTSVGDIKDWGTGSVTNMAHMFHDCEALASLDLSGWDTSNVTDMQSMFQKCNSLTSVGDIKDWGTGSVTNMAHMFHDCEALASLDLSGWDTSKVTDMQSMFSECSKLTSVGDIKDWKTRSVTNMSWMFDGCRTLTSLDLSGWDTSKVKHMNQMFQNCQVLRLNDSIRDWNTDSLIDVYFMFNNCKALVSLDLCKWRTEKVTSMSGMFRGCEKLTTLKSIEKWNVSKVTYMGVMFKGCKALESLDLTSWNTGAVRGMRGMFLDCEILTSLDLSGWNTQALGTKNSSASGDEDDNDIESMFQNCKKLATVKGIESWNVSKVTNMKWVFGGCKALTSLNLHAWNTSKVTTMKDMFQGTSLLKDITLGDKFDIKNNAKFEDAGSNVGTNWMQVGIGTAADPKGQVFKSAKKLAEFHRSGARQKRATEDEQYVRVTPKLTITFAKGADDATGTMEPLSFNYDEEKALTANAYTRVGYDFDGWKDAEGTTYTDGQLFKNTELALNAQKTLTAQWKLKTYTITFNLNVPDGTNIEGKVPDPITVEHGKEPTAPSPTFTWAGKLFTGTWNTKPDGSGTSYKVDEKIKNVVADMILYAQWKDAATLTYKTDVARATLSSQSEVLDPSSGTPSGCTFSMATGIPEGQEVKWTVTKGGKGETSSWSHLGKELGGAKIREVAQKDGKLVDTTFYAELVDKTYTITFNLNVPDGTNIEGKVPDPITVEHGKEPTAPSPTFTWAGKLFTGTWNTKPDGSGTSYKVDEKIKNVVADMILYAQWKDAATLTYKTDVARATLSSQSEVLDPSSGTPSGCTFSMATGIPEGQEVKWTVTKGGKGETSSWSHLGKELGGAKIREVAQKDGKLVDTTFYAELVDKTYTITFNLNVPDGTNIEGKVPDPITVKHGKEPTAPSPTFTWAGKLFTGTWNTKPDGSGTSYKVDEKIKNVVADMILYAQWKDAATLTYKTDVARATLSSQSEVLDPSSGTPSGCTFSMATGIPEGQEVKWTVTKGGKGETSSWSHLGKELGGAKIREVAQKDGKLVDTTFYAELVDKTYTITFNLNVPDGTNIEGKVPDPITVKHGKEPTAPSPTFTWAGKLFTGTWNTKPDGSGTSYKVDEKIKNVVADMILYAQWKDAATLTYKTDVARATLSSQSEVLDPSSGTPSGCTFSMATGIPEGQEVKWTVTKGGKGETSSWSHLGKELGGAKIREVAQKDGKLVDTTFYAELVDKTYTITFNLNVPDGTNIEGKVPDPITVKHGKEPTAPSPTFTWAGKLFTGTWNTKPDGSGTSYKVDEKIKNVVADMILYAQWKDAATLTYKTDVARATLSSQSEVLDPSSGTPSGCTFSMATGIPEGQEVKWTVTKGGKGETSSWSHLGKELGGAKIREVAQKDGKLVDTTFTATLTNKTYTITFDANASGADVGAPPQALTVEHGKDTTAPSGTFTWTGKLFTGTWNTKPDGSGTSYKAGEEIKNVVANMILYAQWKEAATLTYETDVAGATLSSQSEVLDPSSGTPSGCTFSMTAGIPEGQEVKWTVTEGGKGGTSSWSHLGRELGDAKIREVAQKDGKLVSTTFTATLTNKTYTITFDANASGADVGAPPQALTVEHGKEPTAPSATFTWAGKLFTGTWNTKPDGSGTSYKAGEEIKNVVADMILYAQWEDAATLTYKTDVAGATLSSQSEVLDPSSGTPSGCTFSMAAGIPEGQEVKWTVTEGGKGGTSSWSHLGRELGDAKIREVAQKDGKLVDTTFHAELVDKTYTITFDAQDFQDDKSTVLSFTALTVEHGEDLLIPLSYLPSRRDHKFLGWKFQGDPTDSRYPAGATIAKVKRDIAFYSTWEKQEPVEDDKEKEKISDNDTEKDKGVVDGQDPKNNSGEPQKLKEDKPEKEKGSKNKTNDANESLTPKPRPKTVKTPYPKPTGRSSVKTPQTPKGPSHTTRSPNSSAPKTYSVAVPKTNSALVLPKTNSLAVPKTNKILVPKSDNVVPKRSKKTPAMGDVTSQTFFGMLLFVLAVSIAGIAGIVRAAFRRHEKSTQ